MLDIDDLSLEDAWSSSLLDSGVYLEWTPPGIGPPPPEPGMGQSPQEPDIGSPPPGPGMGSLPPEPVVLSEHGEDLKLSESSDGLRSEEGGSAIRSLPEPSPVGQAGGFANLFRSITGEDPDAYDLTALHEGLFASIIEEKCDRILKRKKPLHLMVFDNHLMAIKNKLEEWDAQDKFHELCVTSHGLVAREKGRKDPDRLARMHIRIQKYWGRPFGAQ